MYSRSSWKAFSQPATTLCATAFATLTLHSTNYDRKITAFRARICGKNEQKCGKIATPVIFCTIQLSK